MKSREDPIQQPKKQEQTKKHFTNDEDERLRYYVKQLGDNNWNLIASFMPGRSPRQCRERYIGYLVPNLNTTPWTPEEDQILLRKLLEFGPKWMKMVPYLKGRSDGNIKNRWHKHLKKSVSKNYLDSLSQAPYSHETLLDLNLPDLQPLKDANEDHDKKDDSLETLDQIL